jgi:signal transduction histidine kinase
MSSLIYVRLIGFTAGTLLQLFWMVVILGYRRQRNFERVFFFLCLALFFFYSGSLLALNAQIYYAAPPAPLHTFALTLLCAGLCFLPPLLVHLHIEYADLRGVLGRGKAWKRIVLLAFYSPAVYFGLRVYPLLASGQGFDFLLPGNALGRGYGAWLCVACVVSCGWECRFAGTAPERIEGVFHALLSGLFVLAASLTFLLHVTGRPVTADSAALGSAVLGLLAVVPMSVLIYLVHRYNFLQIGRQKNLMFAVTVTFLALLYLSLVRRVGVWLEPVLPPEASASILLFVLVIFIEPLQRALGRRLEETAHREMDRVQKLIADIQQEARQGNSEALAQFIERCVKDAFELAAVKVNLRNQKAAGERLAVLSKEHGWNELRFGTPRFDLVEGKESHVRLTAGNVTGILLVVPHGAALSGETRAALEFLCEQLPGAVDLCRLIEEKLRLERELAERERLALLGQMAASISHNLKNPLGSIKTILQVQMESDELPASMRAETKMVLGEIGRLSAKLNQLLQFSRPAVRGGSSAEATCDARVVIEEVVGVLRHEAERRGILLDSRLPDGVAKVVAAADAMNDIVSNLLVNALEAAVKGGHVSVEVARSDGAWVLSVEDDGPGIVPPLREKILQPFFTTKAQGTGLGLAIVARRVAEFHGQLEWESPAVDGRGARFRVSLPAEGRTREATKQ